jgi:hypothetical protein
MATDREVDRWRKKAEANLAQANRLLTALLWAAKELVTLTTMHTPDDFAHCPICKVVWPCPTAEQVQHISVVFDKAAPNHKENDGKT